MRATNRNFAGKTDRPPDIVAHSGQKRKLYAVLLCAEAPQLSQPGQGVGAAQLV